MKLLILFCLAFLVFSCGQNETSIKTIDYGENYIPPKEILTNYKCSKSSIELNKLIQILKKDNYQIDTVESEGKAFAKEHPKYEFKDEKTYIIPKHSCISFSAKRKHKLKNKKDNWYPSFRISEFCFSNKELAKNATDTINSIIYNADLINDKNYDYVVLNNNKIIYVSCGAKIFEEYAINYKKHIENLVKN